MIFSMLPLMYLNIPRMGSPFCIATLLFISKTAPAPSLTWLELPKPQKPDDEKDEPNEEFDRRIICPRIQYNTSSGSPIFLKHWLESCQIGQCCIRSNSIINRDSDRLLLISFWIHNLLQ